MLMLLDTYAAKTHDKQISSQLLLDRPTLKDGVVHLGPPIAPF